MDKVAYHPNGQHIITFAEGPHTYTDNFGVRYTSGTSLVGRFFPKFNAIAVSKKCAAGKNLKYAGRDPEEIRAEWTAEGDRGRSEGAVTHAYAEGLMYGWPKEKLPQPISERCKALFVQVERAMSRLRKHFVFIGAEVIVFSPALQIAGTVDLLLYDPTANQIIIGDWKQNKNALSTENVWQRGLQPIEHLEDTDINHYTLQLSSYQYILEKEQYFPGTTGFRRGLIHLTPNSYQGIPLEYFDYEIGEMLKHAAL